MEERSGVIRITRLYDNKRGDFSIQQEELSLTTSSLELQYAECDSEECYQQQLQKHQLMLANQKEIARMQAENKSKQQKPNRGD
jgi:hypothetical protein